MSDVQGAPRVSTVDRTLLRATQNYGTQVIAVATAEVQKLFRAGVEPPEGSRFVGRSRSPWSAEASACRTSTGQGRYCRRLPWSLVIGARPAVEMRAGKARHFVVETVWGETYAARL
jgi:hypothetical protein